MDGRIAIGAALVVGGTVLYAVLLDRLRRFEEGRAAAEAAAGAAEKESWWFGYARDGANVAGGGLCMLGFVIAGLSGPVALFLGVALSLAVYGFDAVVGKWLRPRGKRGIVIAGAASLALLVSLASASLGARVGALLAEVAPR